MTIEPEQAHCIDEQIIPTRTKRNGIHHPCILHLFHLTCLGQSQRSKREGVQPATLPTIKLPHSLFLTILQQSCRALVLKNYTQWLFLLFLIFHIVRCCSFGSFY